MPAIADRSLLAHNHVESLQEAYVYIEDNAAFSELYGFSKAVWIRQFQIYGFTRIHKGLTMLHKSTKSIFYHTLFQPAATQQSLLSITRQIAPVKSPRSSTVDFTPTTYLRELVMKWLQAKLDLQSQKHEDLEPLPLTESYQGEQDYCKQDRAETASTEEMEVDNMDQFFSQFFLPNENGEMEVFHERRNSFDTILMDSMGFVDVQQLMEQDVLTRQAD